MLVLTRKMNERIQIGENVVVTVVRIAEGVVRLGIEAPPETPIVRQELCSKLPEDSMNSEVASRR